MLPASPLVLAETTLFEMALDDSVRANPGMGCWERDGVDGYHERTGWGCLSGGVAHTSDRVTGDQVIVTNVVDTSLVASEGVAVGVNETTHIAHFVVTDGIVQSLIVGFLRGWSSAGGVIVVEIDTNVVIG